MNLLRRGGSKALLLAVLVLPSLATAAVYPCTEAGLDEGLAAGGLVQFACTSAATIPISGTKAVAVSGTEFDGQGRVTFKGSPGFKLFVVTAGRSATFRNLTLTGASLVTLGAALDCSGNGAHCVLDQVTVSANDSSASGGVVYSNGGSITITNSTLSGNTGFAMLFGDGASLSLTSSTVSGGRGAVLARNGTTISIRHSTLVSMTSGVQTVGTSDKISLGHVLFANNGNDVVGSGVTSVGYNVFEDAFAGAQSTDIVGVPARVSTLASNGGPTQTVALQACSPAIDAGEMPATMSFDQRGSGYPRVLQARQDIGAFESNLTAIPCITTQPQGQTVLEAQTLTLSVGAITSVGTLSYQWRRNGTPISGATSATYTKTAEVSDTGTYDVVVSNPVGSVTSDGAMVVVQGPPSITLQPMAADIFEGQPFTLTVEAIGESLEYQWRLDGTAISGATQASFTRAMAAPGDAGEYEVVVSNPSGNVTSQRARVTVKGPPVLTDEPLAMSLFVGQSLMLSVAATGDGLSYQWRRDGATLAQETGATLSIAAVTLQDSGAYDCVVTNGAGSVISPTATVTVKGPPVVTRHPMSAEVAEGAALNLTAEAAGDALTYQWRRDGVELAHATSASYSVAMATVDDSGDYVIVVTNPAGSVTSETATVRVLPGSDPADTSSGCGCNSGAGNLLSVMALIGLALRRRRLVRSR